MGRVAASLLTSESDLGAPSDLRATSDRALPPSVGLQLDDPGHGIDESQMGEGLGEVAQVPAARRLDLFGIEVQGTGKGEQLLAQLSLIHISEPTRQAE